MTGGLVFRAVIHRRLTRTGKSAARESSGEDWGNLGCRVGWAGNKGVRISVAAIHAKNYLPFPSLEQFLSVLGLIPAKQLS